MDQCGTHLQEQPTDKVRTVLYLSVSASVCSVPTLVGMDVLGVCVPVPNLGPMQELLRTLSLCLSPLRLVSWTKASSSRTAIILDASNNQVRTVYCLRLLGQLCLGIRVPTPNLGSKAVSCFEHYCYACVPNVQFSECKQDMERYGHHT